MAVRPAQDGAHPGNQFFHLEGLGQVIIGARIDALDALRPALARRQDDDRHLPPFRTPALQDGQAVELGKPEIEHDGVEVLGSAAVPGIFAVPANLHGKPRRSQAGNHVFGNLPLVLDDQCSHVISIGLRHGLLVCGTPESRCQRRVRKVHLK